MKEERGSRRRKASEEAILEAASAEFATEGFEGARVDAIASRARVNKALIYYYFGGKAHLYEAVLSRNFDRIGASVRSSLSGARDPEERLRAAIRGVVAALRLMPDHPRLMMREMAAGAVHLTPGVLGKMGELFGVVRSTLEEGQLRGAMRPNDTLVSHLAVMGSIVFLVASAPIRARFAEVLGWPEAELPWEELPDRIADFALYGLASGPGRSD